MFLIDCPSQYEVVLDIIWEIRDGRKLTHVILYVHLEVCRPCICLVEDSREDMVEQVQIPCQAELPVLDMTDQVQSSSVISEFR